MENIIAVEHCKLFECKVSRLVHNYGLGFPLRSERFLIMIFVKKREAPLQ